MIFIPTGLSLYIFDQRERYGGCWRGTQSLEDQLGRAGLALEVGKSPTEVTRGRHVPEPLPSAIFEFDGAVEP